jgi:hypothetical protein
MQLKAYAQMKRYRFTNFFLDSTRSLLKQEGALTHEQREEIIQQLRGKYGEADFDAKLKRFLEFDSPNVRLVTEYHQLLEQVADSYILGQYFPALTGACCLGEKIFNVLILTLRDHFKHSRFYKRIHRKDFVQDWDLAIDVLSEWDIVGDSLREDYIKLKDVRHASIHPKYIADFHDQAFFALQHIMNVTHGLFGLRNDVFFWVPGEPYIRKDKEPDPLVKEFFVPNCKLVGYKHSVRLRAALPQSVGFIYDDPYEYENREITDEEFRQLREEWTKHRSGGSQGSG